MSEAPGGTPAPDQDAPKLGTPEYDAAMAAKFDKSQDPATFEPKADPGVTPDVPNMPEGGHEKFYNKETGAYDWQSHAKEAEWQAAQAREKATKGDDAGDTGDKAGEGEGASTGSEEVDNAITKAGYTVEALGQQILETGDLDDKAKAALVDAGIPKDLVDEYVELAKFKISTQTTGALEYLGNGQGEEAGQAEWDKISAWADKNLTDSEKLSYNAQLRGADWKVAVDTLRTKMQADSPTAGEGSLVAANQSGAGTVVGFNTRKEQTEAMNALDQHGRRKYDTDSEYRRQVQQRVAASTYAGELTR